MQCINKGSSPLACESKTSFLAANTKGLEVLIMQRSQPFYLKQLLVKEGG